VAARRNDASDATADVVRQQLGFAVGPFSTAWTSIDANASAQEARNRAMLILTAGETVRLE
jgi:hypothetical protein